MAQDAANEHLFEQGQLIFARVGKTTSHVGVDVSWRMYKVVLVRLTFVCGKATYHPAQTRNGN